MAAALPRAVDKIRATARDLFYRQGIRAVGVDEIVRQAGVTKPSLYRSFVSKDELAADYLSRYEGEFWKRFDAAVDAHPGNPRAQIHECLARLSERASAKGYRGCGMTNAVVEYPTPGNPARQVAVNNKQTLRKRVAAIVREMNVRDPEVLADGLLLLMEGAFITSQIFGEGGPARSVAHAADALMDAHLPVKRKAK
jgi:AcrR family transcriptional regulator